MPPEQPLNQPPSTPVTPTVEPLKKGHAKPVLLLVILLLLISSLFLIPYFIPTNNSGLSINTEDTLENSSDNTSNWQTYRSEEYGFEIKLPLDWKLEKPDYITDEKSLHFISDLTRGIIKSMKECWETSLYCRNEYPSSDMVFMTTPISESIEYILGDPETKVLNGNEFKIFEDYTVSFEKYVFETIRNNKIYVFIFDDNHQGIKVISTFKFINSAPQSTGTLTGKVTIGPNCPVERERVPCPTSPEAYAAREFLVLNNDKKQVAKFHADAQGNFNLTLPAGTYTVTSAKTGMGFMSGSLPKTIAIESGQPVILNIDVDTGIR